MVEQSRALLHGTGGPRFKSLAQKQEINIFSFNLHENTLTPYENWDKIAKPNVSRPSTNQHVENKEYQHRVVLHRYLWYWAQSIEL